MSRFHFTNLRAAWWAIRTARRTRRLLTTEGLDATLPPPPPPQLPVEAERGVRGALRRWRGTCLVNAIVLQAWEAAHGKRRDLVIGTTGPQSFSAHAWLEGDPLPTADDAGLDASLLGASRGAGWEAPPGSNGTDPASSDGNGAVVAFHELLRRPAPDYQRR